MRIELKGLRFHAFHGVLPQERTVGGDYEVDISVDYADERAVETDNVEDTLNYAELYDIVKEEMAQPSNLLEHVAGRIGKRTLKTFSGAHSVTVAVTKLNPPIGGECRGARVVISHPRTHVPTNPRKEER